MILYKIVVVLNCFYYSYDYCCLGKWCGILNLLNFKLKIEVNICVILFWNLELKYLQIKGFIIKFNIKSFWMIIYFWVFWYVKLF